MWLFEMNDHAMLSPKAGAAGTDRITPSSLYFGKTMSHFPIVSKKAISAKPRKSVLLVMGFYVHEINIGVAKYARLANWILDDVASRNSMMPPGWKGDGVVALIPSFPIPSWNQKELIKFVSDIRVPVVDSCDQLPNLRFPRVLPDNEAIGRVAAEHLISRGFQHFAFYTDDKQAPVVKERMAGFRVAEIKAGREFHL
jgi:LacI family transcriptional regulator